MKLKSLLVATVIAVFAVGSAFAEEKSSPVNVGLMVYMDYTANLSAETHAFNLTRAYLMVDKQFSEAWSARMILDGSVAVLDDDNEPSGGINHHGFAILKNLDITGKTKLGPLDAALNFGVIDTPYVAYMAGLNGDFWINADGMLASGAGVDPAYDLGVGLKLGYEKLVCLYTTFTNGEGFKNLDGETSDAKSLGMRLAITPMESVYINAFFYHNAEGIGNKQYIGGGAAYKTDMIKAGANVLYYMGKDGGAGIDGNMTIDAWVNANLNSVVGMPVLASLHYTMQDKAETDHYLGVGAGYQATKGLDLMVYYTYNTNDEDSILSFRTQTKF